MPDIALATFNARYEHASLGLRCLMANLGALAGRASLHEFTLDTRAAEAAEALLAGDPKIVGLGVYVWNARESAALAAELKAIRPGLLVVMGGPEAGHGGRAAVAADYVIRGEGEKAFPVLCARLLAGERPEGGLIEAEPPDLAALELPYSLYTDADLAGRLVYTEASRGCPFGCEFCLSSLDRTVRYFPLERLFAAWQVLLDRGLLRFKFTDRTFNLDMDRAAAVLNFFLERYRPGLFLHFEMVPDRFPEELLALVKKFPAGSLQLEIGLQTFDPAVAARIGRRQDCAAAGRNVARLRAETAAYIHADLIAGLPGEDEAAFAAGFDRLYALRPHEIQVGILKRLPGAPIARHDAGFRMVYSPEPPYEVRSTSVLDFPAVQRLRRFARYWDLVANSGLFPETAARLCAGPSPYAAFMKFSLWLHARTGRTCAISRAALRTACAEYLSSELGLPAAEAAAMTDRDALKAHKAARAGAARQDRRA